MVRGQDEFLPHLSLLFWINRFNKFLEDALLYGIIIELDFFDVAMTNSPSDWKYHPFNPKNQLLDQKNEIVWDPNAGCPDFSKQMYRTVVEPANVPKLLDQQSIVVYWTTRYTYG